MKKRILLFLSLVVFAIVVTNFNLVTTGLNAKELYSKNSEVQMTNQVSASHLLVSTREDAVKIREEILAGRDFADAAAEVSQCPSGANGGDLGFFGRGQMVPEFENVAFTLPIGEVSEPIQTQFGWHLIIVTDKK